MIKIAAISGLVIAGITVIIFMSRGGPCDTIVNPNPPPFSSDRGEGVPNSGSGAGFGAGFLDYVREIQCGLTKKSSGSSQEAQSSPSASQTPEDTNPPSEKSGSGKKTLKAIFSLGNKRGGSLRNASKIEIKGNVVVEIKKDGTSTGENLFDWLPVKVVLKAGNQKVWETEVTKDSGCRELFHNQYCTLPNFKYDSAWDGKRLFMYAYDKNGEWLAFHYEE
ncbi:hypothetical protein HY358_00475 [Candidatus Roizmanbacteria bacterium]|nr:hypothetical protein [Candidatus Roizmanbacteria bacterium]